LDSRVPIVGQIQIFSYWCVVEEVLCEDNIKVGDFSFSFFGKQEVFVSCFVYVYFSSVEFTQVVSKIHLMCAVYLGYFFSFLIIINNCLVLFFGLVGFQDSSHTLRQISSYCFKCMRWIMSRQSLKTRRIFSVSTAHVKCG